MALNSTQRKMDNITLETPYHTPKKNTSAQAQNYKTKNHGKKYLQAYAQWQSSNPFNNKLSSMNSIQRKLHILVFNEVCEDSM